MTIGVILSLSLRVCHGMTFPNARLDETHRIATLVADAAGTRRKISETVKRLGIIPPKSVGRLPDYRTARPIGPSM